MERTNPPHLYISWGDAPAIEPGGYYQSNVSSSAGTIGNDFQHKTG
jgi:hypothetical protein